jgi:segregation and condensation protein B
MSEVRDAIAILQKEYESSSRGIRIACTEETAEMVSAPENFGAVKKIIEYEAGELSQAKLETLTILAYQGPLVQAEIEHIRGVNCTQILKNLKIDDLIDEVEENGRLLYHVSTKFLKLLGITSTRELPEHETLQQK